MAFKILLEQISTNIEKIIEEFDCPKIQFVVQPAKPGFGDVTCNASFLLSKHLKKKPSDIAEVISEKYQKYLGDLIVRVQAHRTGYLNFFADWIKLNEIILKASTEDDYGAVDIGKQSQIVVEHTSVNPNKALHIGHVRNVIIGDTVARILNKTNFDVKVLNYIDDSGLQIADIIVGFKHLGFSEEPPLGYKFDKYCGDIVYVKTTEKYEDDPHLQDIRNKILQQLEDEKSQIAQFASIITKRVLAEQLKTCWRLDVSYDCLNFESQIIRSKLWKETFEKLKELKLIEFENEGKNKGCWLIKGQEGQEDKVLVRSNGTATYIAKDISYAAWKLGILEDPFSYIEYEQKNPPPSSKILWQTTTNASSKPKQNFTGKKIITVIDSRQVRLQKIITNLMSQLASDENAYIHLGYESVTLSADTAQNLGLDTKGKQAQMSGRKGLYINADSVLDLLEDKVTKETKKRNPDADPKTISQIAHEIAVGTIRYEMIKQDLDKIITFDFKKSLSLEGDTAPYIQYTYARASRILEKSGVSPDYNASYELLETTHETNLVKIIGMFDLQVQDASNNFSPKVIARYCYDIAVAFNAFYENVKVLDSTDKQQVVNARLCLVDSFKSTLAKALELLGISAPPRM